MSSPNVGEPGTRPSLRWGAVFAFWTILGVLSAGQYYSLLVFERQPITLGRALLLQLPTWYFWALATPLILFLGRRFRLERGRWLPATLMHAAVAVTLGLVNALIGVLLYLRFPVGSGGPTPFELMFRAQLNSRFQFYLLTYAAILGAGYAVEFYQRFRQRELQTVRLEAELSQAQLQALKMQLHPHFLFNTLHAIAVLVNENPKAATRTVALLGDLLRLTLANAGTNEVPLREELQFLKLYLEIEQTRFQDRLTVSYDIAPDTLDTAVPNFILQPLVENAVRHGVAPRAEPGRIIIQAHRRDGSVEIAIRDDGPGLPGGLLPSDDEGIGLATTRARLAMMYGPRQRLELTNEPEGGLRVAVTIPITGAGVA